MTESFLICGMRAIFILGILSVSCFLLTGLIQPDTQPVPSRGLDSSISYFKTEAPQFASSCKVLRLALQSIDPASPRSIADARQKLINCRLQYKRIESFLEYFFPGPTRIYNAPPKFEPEEPDMEYQSPVGLQVIESLLYDNDHRPLQKKELLQQADAVTSSATDLSSLLYDFQANDRQLLESLRVELIRIMSLGITGYDAPSLKSGLAESREALLSMRFQLRPFLIPGESRSDSLLYFLDKAIGQLRDHPGFDAFDRLAFLTGSALPLQHQLSVLIRERRLELNTNGVLNYEADNLFSSDALLPDNFPRGDAARASAAAGRILFSDKSLSGNGQRSCATCHSPEKMFTDQLPANKTFDGHGSLKRNTPTLLYSGFQYRQFWDGRVNTLEDQVRAVLHDSLEMNGAARSEQETARIATAIAAYVRSLHPMNSPFDHYMQGALKALNAREIKGANLFMGKAQCATCHFIPLFNGLIPPDYKVTEFEILGTPRTDQFDRPRLSTDEGRYALFPFDFFKGAFKTPTVRNVANTYPYMHNGSFHSLEKVLEFYNKGGGAGLGLKVPEQTLPSTPLHLTNQEMQDIILFMRALTDDLKATDHKS
jgi:cytochrome c peroxidase